MPENFELTEIDHVAIAVNDLEAAIAWYAEVFGWMNATVVPRLPGRGASSMTRPPEAFTLSRAAAQSSTR